MKYFKTTDEIHEIKVTPRYYSEVVTLKLTHQLTKTETIIDYLETYTDNGYLIFNFEYDFIINGHYSIEITSNNNLIWLGKAQVNE